MYNLSSVETGFIEGMARTIDFDDNLQQFHFSESPEEADAQAIYSDFYSVGRDFIDFLENNYPRASKKEK